FAFRRALLMCYSSTVLWPASGYGNVGGDDQVSDPPSNVDALLVAGNLARHVCAFHDQAQFPCQLTRVGRPGLDGQIVHDLFEGAFMVRCGDMRWLVWQRKLHRHINKDAALKIVGVDDVIHDVEQDPELAHRRWAATFANHLTKRLLQ